MKKTQSPLCFLLPLFALAGSLAASEESTSSPQGSLEALQAIVVEGTKADLDWQVTYPPHNFNETDSIVKVQFITAAIGPRWKIQFGTRVDGGAYQEFYHGVSEEHRDYALEHGAIISETFVSAGSKIEFLAKHETTRIAAGWVSSENTAQAQQFIELHKGDPVPAVAPVPGQRSVAEILAPYTKGGLISIGQNQKIILFEIYTDDTTSRGFDLQDLVLLVSHEQVPLEE